MTISEISNYTLAILELGDDVASSTWQIDDMNGERVLAWLQTRDGIVYFLDDPGTIENFDEEVVLSVYNKAVEEATAPDAEDEEGEYEEEDEADEEEDDDDDVNEDEPELVGEVDAGDVPMRLSDDAADAQAEMLEAEVEQIVAAQAVAEPAPQSHPETKTVLFTVPESIQDNMNAMSRELQELREAVNPELVSGLGMIIEALTDSVTQRSRLVTRSFLKMVAHVVSVYERLEGKKLVVNGNAVNTETCENWDNAYMTDVFARIAQDYRMSKTNLMHGLGELPELRQRLEDERKLKVMLESTNKLNEAKIEALRKSTAYGLKETNERLQAKLAAETAAREAAEKKLATYASMPELGFVVYCHELNGFIRVNHKSHEVEVSSHLYGDSPMTIFPSMDVVNKNLPTLAIWTAALAENARGKDKRDAGQLHLTFTPMEITQRSGQMAAYRSRNGKLEPGPVSERALPVAPTRSNINLAEHAAAYVNAELDDDEYVQPRDFTDAGVDLSDLEDLDAGSPKTVNKAPEKPAAADAAACRLAVAKRMALIDDEDAYYAAMQNPASLASEDEDEAVGGKVAAPEVELEDLDDVPVAAPKSRFTRPSPTVKLRAVPQVATAGRRRR